MTRNRMDRRKNVKLFCAVLAVGMVMSALVAVALIFMGQTHPRF